MKIKIYAVVLLFVLGAVGGVFYFSKEQGTKGKEQLPNGIVIEDLGGGEKLVKNVEEGFEVEVPIEWDVRSLSDESHKIKMVYEGGQQKDGTTLSDGILFDIYCYDNKKNESVLAWINSRGDENIEKLNVNNKEVYKSTSKIAFSEDSLGRPIFLENSQVISYLFNFNTQICEASCSVAGDNYLVYAQQCEDDALKSLTYK